MNGTASADSLIIYWVVVSIMALVIALLALRWAVRTRQFSDPARSARLPLEGVIPEDDPEHAEGQEKK
ncbi:MAG: cbb3-type cytochrome oxidase assembly protein CcoS [Desulfobulbaceae bacterium]|nr:cbb3-type cytochrome oxidase assembly protein CcoS [Desulfobulbaceae bacterium]